MGDAFEEGMTGNGQAGQESGATYSVWRKEGGNSSLETVTVVSAGLLRC